MQKSDNTRIRRFRIIAGVLAGIWAVAIFVLSAIPGESYPEHPGFLNYFAHFGEYLVLGALLAVALTGGRLKVWQVVLIASLVASAYAATDEFHQLFVPGRLSEPIDWLTDTLGAITGALLTALVLNRSDRRNKTI